MRNSTWNGIGTEVKASNVSEALKLAKIDYEVEKRDICLGNTEIIIPDKKATCIKGTNEILGVVSDRYEICQNEEAFSIIDNVPNVEIVRAGQTYTGMVYVIGKLPDTTVLGDTFTPYLIFQNGHNGKYTTKTTISPLRMVCQNQFNMAFRNSMNTISIRHSRNYATRLTEAEKLLAETAEYMQTFGDTAEELALLKVGNEDNVQKIINAFFTYKPDATDRQIATVEEQRAELLNAYRADDNANFSGTVWGLVNGFSDYITHREVKNTKNKADTQFMSVTFDPRMFEAFVAHARAFAV